MVTHTRCAHVWTALSTGLIMLLAAAGCSSDKSDIVSVATTLAANPGVSGQTGTVGQVLPTPISVHLTDQNGAAMSGVAITWSVVGSGGSVDSATSTTNSNGDAVTDWTLGTVVGTDSLNASTASGLTTAISATANAGAFTTMVKVSGDSQAVAAGSAGQPLVVRTVDQYGNAVSGVTVNWVVSGGGTLSAASSTSDANGLAQVTLTTDPAPASYTVTASSGAATPIVFTQTGS